LTLPFPVRGFRYDISWMLPSGPPPSEVAQAVWSHRETNRIGRSLVQACVAAFDDTPWRRRVYVTAYIPRATLAHSSRFLRRIAHIGYQREYERAPVDIDLRNAPAPYRDAWRHEIVVTAAEATDDVEQRLAHGMLEHEIVTAYLPVREIDEGGPPIALLRVGLSRDQVPLALDADLPIFERALALAQARTISSVLQEM
jgi:hypothetical protein